MSNRKPRMGNYLRQNGNRTITVKKSDLLKKIKENKSTHEKAYAKAVVAYKKEALKQLAEQTKAAKEGNLRVYLNLTTPIDNKDHYDKLIRMFEWEVAEEVVLSQQEFNEYVEDDTEVSRHAFLSNSMYLAG